MAILVVSAQFFMFFSLFLSLLQATPFMPFPLSSPQLAAYQPVGGVVTIVAGSYRMIRGLVAFEPWARDVRYALSCLLIRASHRHRGASSCPLDMGEGLSALQRTNGINGEEAVRLSRGDGSGSLFYGLGSIGSCRLTWRPAPRGCGTARSSCRCLRLPRRACARRQWC